MTTSTTPKCSFCLDTGGMSLGFDSNSCPYCQPGSDWQSMETAPKDGTLIRIKPSYGLPEMDGRWRERSPDNWGWAWVAGRHVDPTHWKPTQPDSGEDG